MKVLVSIPPIERQVHGKLLLVKEAPARHDQLRAFLQSGEPAARRFHDLAKRFDIISEARTLHAHALQAGVEGEALRNDIRARHGAHRLEQVGRRRKLERQVA